MKLTKEKNNEDLNNKKEKAEKITKKRTTKKTNNIKETKLTTSKKETKKTTSTKNTTEKTKKNNSYSNLVEYYDLPYRYNQTVIKILAQTPNSIFVYWDISDSDKEQMIKNYGPNVFNDTIPILIVHNQTTHSTFEIEINDFANSWYLKTPTSDCIFTIELGRKKIPNRNETNINTLDNKIHITTSNNLTSPNDHFLTETLYQNIYFKNIKTNEIEEIKISDLKPISQIYECLQKDILTNPSSNFKI